MSNIHEHVETVISCHNLPCLMAPKMEEAWATYSKEANVSADSKVTI